jgi:carbon monoxide dehydrogenase subunit G
MAGFSTSMHVAAPPRAVFDLFTDLEHMSERISGIEKITILTDGPVGLGTRWRETRVIMKKSATEELDITAFEPGRSFEVSCESCGARYLSVHRFEPEDGGTRFEFEMRVTPVSLAAKVLSPVTGLLMGPMMRKCIEKDFDEMRVVAEGKA